MARRFITAPFVLLAVLVMLAVLYGAFAPAIEPMFDVFQQSEGVQSDETPVDGGMIEQIASVLFVQGPMVFLAGGILFLFLAALKFEGVVK